MNTGETIALIKAFGKGGGSSLPSVTSSDNGKVLAVKDGAWAAGSPYVLVTVASSVASLKGSEIKSLAASGVEVLLKDSDGLYAFVTSNGASAIFTGITNAVEAKKVTVADSKAVSRTYRSIYSKPSDGIPETDLAQAVKDKLNKFLVTLTPTAPDYSGTMDKTPAEITAAYNAGQEIVFDIPSMNAKINATQFIVENDAVRAGGMVFYDVNSSPVIITVITSSTVSTYATQVFAMTPAS